MEQHKEQEQHNGHEIVLQGSTLPEQSQKHNLKMKLNHHTYSLKFQ